MLTMMKQPRHWSVNERQFSQRAPHAYRLWQIEQRVNVGLGPTKLRRADLKRYWRKLRLDPDRKQYLARLLWPERS